MDVDKNDKNDKSVEMMSEVADGAAGSAAAVVTVDTTDSNDKSCNDDRRGGISNVAVAAAPTADGVGSIVVADTESDTNVVDATKAAAAAATTATTATTTGNTSSTSTGDSRRRRTRADDILDKMQFEDGQRDTISQLIEDAKRNKRPGEVIVVNDVRLMHPPKGTTPVFLGHVVYTGAHSRNPHSNRAADLQLFLLPQFTTVHHYATIEVRVPAEFLTYRGNIAVRKSALWGTDVYTDDSDVVAMIIHSGHYRPVDAPDPQPEEHVAAAMETKVTAATTATALDGAASSDANAEAASKEASAKEGASLQVGGMAGRGSDLQTTSHRLTESPISSPVQPLVAVPDATTNVLFPDHDLHVTLRVLPKLFKYTGSTRYGLDSHGWGSTHDGESLMVERVGRVERGSVGRKGRKVFSKRWGELAKAVTKEGDYVYVDGAVIDRRVNSDGHDTANGDCSHGGGDVTMLFSEYDGVACIKYSPRVMMEWPAHLLSVLSDGKSSFQVNQQQSQSQLQQQSQSQLQQQSQSQLQQQSQSQSQLQPQQHQHQQHSRRRSSMLMLNTAVAPSVLQGALLGDEENGARFSRQDLEGMRTWPYWRVKLTRFVCVLEGVRGERYELGREGTEKAKYVMKKLRVAASLSGPPAIEMGDDKDKAKAVASGIGAEAFEWTEGGVAVRVGEDAVERIGVHKVHWKRMQTGPERSG